jgi:hypothetical protein
MGDEGEGGWEEDKKAGNVRQLAHCKKRDEGGGGVKATTYLYWAKKHPGTNVSTFVPTRYKCAFT